MSKNASIQKMLQPQRRVRYLTMIAILKIVQGALLLVLGLSLLFLNGRTAWMEAISNWADDELALVHSEPALYLLDQLQHVVAGGQLRVTGLVSLFFAAVLITVGIGVYLQKHWAELLLICATGALIPFEVRHLWHRPGAVAVIIVVVNCSIVWYLYRVLRRERREATAPPAQSEVVGVR